MERNAEEKIKQRLEKLLELQGEIERFFGSDGYNIFVFGSYLTNRYEDGRSDIDIAVYTEDFELYKALACYMEDYFQKKRIKSDIFYIDTRMVAPLFCAPLRSQIQFTDYVPDKLVEFHKQCERALQDVKARMAG